jgi:hypothetical protein
MMPYHILNRWNFLPECMWAAESYICCRTAPLFLWFNLQLCWRSLPNLLLINCNVNILFKDSDTINYYHWFFIGFNFNLLIQVSYYIVRSTEVLKFQSFIKSYIGLVNINYYSYYNIWEYMNSLTEPFINFRNYLILHIFISTSCFWSNGHSITGHADTPHFFKLNPG